MELQYASASASYLPRARVYSSNLRRYSAMAAGDGAVAAGARQLRLSLRELTRAAAPRAHTRNTYGANGAAFRLQSLPSGPHARSSRLKKRAALRQRIFSLSAAEITSPFTMSMCSPGSIGTGP